MELNLYASVCTKALLAQLYGTRTPSESLMKQLLSLRHTQTHKHVTLGQILLGLHTERHTQPGRGA